MKDVYVSGLKLSMQTSGIASRFYDSSGLTKLKRKLAKELGIPVELVKDSFYGGSRVICKPAPTDTDCDIVLFTSNLDEFAERLTEDWEAPVTVEENYVGEHDATFRTFRSGEYNLMVFSNPQEFGAVKGTTALAKACNVLNKATRYSMFEAARSPWR